MSKVPAKLERATLTECNYSFPEETLNDICSVRSVYSDLRVYVDFYCFPTKEKRKLVYLAGTIPVNFDGTNYNIPVCLWLHQSHPTIRPRCYVCPSVSMVINPTCSWVEAGGHVSLDYLRDWTSGVSNLPLLIMAMRQAFQKDTPLYATPPLLNQPGQPDQDSSSSNQTTWRSSPHPSGSPASQKEDRQPGGRRSYTEELLGIDFSTSSSSHFLSPPSSGAEPEPGSKSEAGLQTPERPCQAQRRLEQRQVPACLPPDKVAIFLSLSSVEGRSFQLCDIMEAVQQTRDLPSALRYLSHTCPICQDLVSLSKMVTMTQCSCSVCESCFKTYFWTSIRERSIDLLVCPLCKQPDLSEGLEHSMDYFNLLDTQIRHYLDPQSHEMFQQKLRDRTLQEMPLFCWCSHCSFGVLHESGRLRMDCPSCKKSTCSQCRAAWDPQHEGRSCQQFREMQNLSERPENLPEHNKLVCPQCLSLFYLSRGGCLHITCLQCRHQFCGNCLQPFSLGAACGFSVDCQLKGLHAHHPRDCLYHLRDWSTTRLHQLLQYYRVPLTWVGPAYSSCTDTNAGVCSVLELKEPSDEEQPCGRPVTPGHRGYCLSHYKEFLVDMVQRSQADPAVLFNTPEILAELQRWHVAVPSRKPQEPEQVYTQRLHLTLFRSLPLKRHGASLTCPETHAAFTAPPAGDRAVIH